MYVDTVSASFPFLPEHWESRLRAVDAGVVVARCLEATDLAVSKLAAGRLKDFELIAALIGRNLVDVERVRERIGGTADPHMRAILSARLQIVLESIGRAR